MAASMEGGRPPCRRPAPSQRCGILFHLPLAAQVRLELGKNAEHVEERLASGARHGVDRLLRRLERNALGLQRAYDVLKIAYGPRQPVDAGDHQRVASADQLEQCVRSSSRPCLEVPLTFSLRITSQPASRLERRELHVEVLPCAAHAGVANLGGHFVLCVSFGFRPLTKWRPRKPKVNSSETPFPSHRRVLLAYTQKRRELRGNCRPFPSN